MANEVDIRAGEATTVNYGWVKPTVGASVDAWGGYLNSDLDGIDATVHSVSGVANAAYPASNPSGYQTAAQVTAALPVVTTTTPAMDGTATIGSTGKWADGGHIHPTDTSRYAASNPSNYITAATLPIASTTVLGGVKVDGTTIKAAGDGTISTTVVPLGDNRIINGNFAVNQRGYVSGTALPASPTVANGYGHDRWKAGAGGCTYTFTASVPDTTITITANTLTQIIEAGMIEGGVYTLSWTGTAQARVWQGTAAGSYAASPIVTASLTAGANTTVEFNAGTVGKVKLEIGSVATPFNRQSLAKSLADCQRYYQVATAWGQANLPAATAIYGVGTQLIVAMRAGATITVLNGSMINLSGASHVGAGNNTIASSGSVVTGGSQCTINVTFSASAEL